MNVNKEEEREKDGRGRCYLVLRDFLQLISNFGIKIPWGGKGNISDC